MTNSSVGQPPFMNENFLALARFFLENQAENYQDNVCLVGAESLHGSNTAHSSYDSRKERSSSLRLLSDSRASKTSPTLTRASPDDHWRFKMLRHLGNETNIRIPPYRVVTSPSTGTEAVIEDQISGEDVITLGEAWNTLDERLRYRAVVQTREMLKALRVIKPKDIPQRPVIADRYISRPGANPVNRVRTYRNNAEFVGILKDSIAAVAYDADLVRSAVEFVDMLRTSRHELVFTHGNLTADKIYISEWTGDVLAIADWSEAGYYPLYWEFIKAKLSYNKEQNFDRDGAVEIILKPWRIELALMKPAHEIIF